MEQTCIFDAHCDTFFELQEQNLELEHSGLHLDLERMERYENYIQVFAAFVDKTSITMSPMNHCLRLIERYHRELKQHGDRIISVTDLASLEAAGRPGKVGAVLSLEGGEALEGNLSALWMYYQLGVRLITLTWNHANELADGITESRGGGLTEFGRKAVAMMEDLGMLIDVSHLSEAGFWDVEACTKHPFVASHSCAKALCPHPRNLTDEQIKAIISRRGGVGVNFYPEFLTLGPTCTLDTIADHILYMVELGGIECVGLGSDFDGVESLPQGMSGVQDMSALIQCLSRRGLSRQALHKVAYGNFYRIFHETLRR